MVIDDLLRIDECHASGAAEQGGLTMVARMLAAAAAVIVASTGIQAEAQTAVSFTKNSGGAGASAQTRGFEFSFSAPETITALGWYDADNDGLVDAHQVGIFSSAGTLLIGGTVSAGTTDPLSGFFRYTSALTGTTSLGAGTYFVGGLSTLSDATYRDLDASSVTFGNGVTYIQDATNGVQNLFSAPLEHGGFDIGYFGANFQYAAAAVPEPATWMMMILGVGMVGGFMRRKVRASEVQFDAKIKRITAGDAVA